MATIDEIIQQEANPFDPVTFKTGNFWQEDDTTVTSTVDSIHQEAIDQITQLLNLVAKDHYTRTVLLAGDAGSGKSYLLKRLKDTLNSKAFFVYIPPFVDNDHIWRHTLRQTVDSLMHKPEGEQESQLMLWLKSLSVFSDRSLMRKLLGERNLFINNFKSAYPTGIYQAKEFFGALHDLNNPDLYFTACSWLRGEDLDEDDLKTLKIKKSIDSEAAAQGILANLGKISTSTYPIVLCFDQVESKQLSDKTEDIQPVFNINTSFHNERLKNFLIIISIVTDVWRRNRNRIEQSDKDRVEKSVILKPITLEQAESLWAIRLRPLHSQGSPKPDSNIYPLTRDVLERKFPGGKTTPRLALVLAHQLLLHHKLEKVIPGLPPNVPIETDLTAAFRLLWEKEFSKTEQKITRIRHFSEPELVSMLSRALAALQMQNIQPKLLPSPTFASYSFSYREPQENTKKGLIWAENPSKTFFHTMNSCALAEKEKVCQEMYLVRAEGNGKTNTKGYKLFKEIFIDSPRNRHVKPDLESVHHLATYDRLVNSVHSQELVISGKTLKLSELEALVRDSEVLKSCSLLQDLGFFPKSPIIKPALEREKAFLLNFIKTHHLIARRVVTQTTLGQFPKLADAEIEQLIQELCQEKQIRILDESVKPNEQIICLIPAQQMGQ
ncbi:MAG: P-loop NTPase fold protein [Leptolyngbyaceae cyanobacterium bins.349]|nr:P-loop NTPase fold protein [Leptolyngbyaceae cyanobacterium bins.349]